MNRLDPIKALVIEDDRDDAITIEKNLTRRQQGAPKFQLTFANRLEEGLDLARKINPQIILLDLSLPDSQGIETFEVVHRTFPRIPIVILSGLQDETLALEAVRKGAQDYLVKGEINSRMLIRVVRYAIERERAEERYREVYENFRKLFEGSKDAMVFCAMDGRITDVNEAFSRLTGYSMVEILGGRNYQDLSPMEYHSSNAAMIQRLLVTGEPVEFEREYLRKDGSRVPVLLTILLIHGSGGEPAGFAALIKDMTERKRLDRLKDEFVGNVSHELRTPLTAVKGSLANLKQGIGGNLTTKQKETLEISLSNMARLERLIGDLLDLSRLESGHASITPRPVQLPLLIDETIDLFRPLAVEKQLSLQTSVAPDLPLVSADAEMVSRVLNNLLDNALRYAHQRIFLKASRDGTGRVQISVMDDGAGIPADQLGTLFNKFVQINRPTGGSGYKGTGLGLAICKDIVTLHGGEIWAESRVGEGTTLHFTLPLPPQRL